MASEGTGHFDIVGVRMTDMARRRSEIAKIGWCIADHHFYPNLIGSNQAGMILIHIASKLGRHLMDGAVALFGISDFGLGTKSWTANRNRQGKTSLMPGCSVPFHENKVKAFVLD